MEVKIINPTETKELFKHWGEFSKTCYDTKNVAPEKIGKHCMESRHFSGSRTRYIEMEIKNVNRAIIDQLCRHEEGVVKNVQSTRYVDKNGFTYDIPVEIINNDELVKKYILHMEETQKLYTNIQEYIITNQHKSGERANEQARMVLPLSLHTNVAVGFTVEALMHYMNTRLCVRAEKEHRDLAKAIKKAVLEVLPELKDKLVPQCEELLYCPEARGCGAYCSKEELKNKIDFVNELIKLGTDESIDSNHTYLGLMDKYYDFMLKLGVDISEKRDK